MLNSLQNAMLFLINTIFDLYLFILIARLILCWIRSDYYNPITQFIVKCTKPLIAPLKKIIPTYANIEFSTLGVIIFLEIIKYLLIGIIAIGLPKNPLGLLLLASADTFKLVLNTFFYAIFLQAILSWIQPGYSPVGYLLNQLTAPVMRPIQRFVPPVGGFDISPIPALILLQLLIIVLVNPLLSFGTVIAFG